MAIASALKELFGIGPDVTQEQTAQRLRDAGMSVQQTQVSAWLRNRVPNLDQLAQIEDAYNAPRGWILHRAGFVDIPALVELGGEPIAERPAASQRGDDLPQKLLRLEGLVDELQIQVDTLSQTALDGRLELLQRLDRLEQRGEQGAGGK